MSLSISSAGSANVLHRLLSADTGPGIAGKTGGVGFEEIFLNALRDASRLDNEAQQSIQTHVMGGDVTDIQVFTQMKKADLALKMLLQIRNKLLQGFQEIKQMQM